MIFYFGTFNPVHIGHLKIAERIEQLYKEPVIFIPAYDSPWKPDLKENFEHRVKMIRLCGQACSDIEKNLPTPSYTYQTVNLLYDLFGKSWGKVKMIIGYDQYFSLPKWKRPATLKRKCQFIVIPRDNDLARQENFFEHAKMKADGWDAHIIEMPMLNISSSEIRERLHNNEPVSYLAPQVLKYIRENNLY